MFPTKVDNHGLLNSQDWNHRKILLLERSSNNHPDIIKHQADQHRGNSKFS